MKLATRLTLLFFILSVIPLGVVEYLAFVNGRGAIENNTFTRLREINILKEAELDRWIEGNTNILRALSRRPLVWEFSKQIMFEASSLAEIQAARQSLIHDHLIPSLEIEGGFEDLYILNPEDGMIILSTDGISDGKFRENEAFFVEGLVDTYIQNVSFSISRAEPVMRISTPVIDRDGELIAVLAGHVDFSEISEIMESGRGFSASEETYLVNKFNFFVTESRFEEGYALQKATYTEGVSECLMGNEGAALYDDYRGVPIIGIYKWLPERELCILTKEDQAEAFAPIVTLRNEIIGAGAVIAVIAGAVGLLVTRTITGPIQKLVVGTEEIGQGNLGYQIKVDAKDEIGQLANAFNNMTTNLLQSMGEVAHGQSLLEALGQAALAVQRARTSLEVHETVGIELEKLGYHSIALDLVNRGESLSISHVSFASDVITGLKKLTGLSPIGYTFPIELRAEYKRIIESGETVYFDEVHEKIAEALPRGFRHLTGRIAGIFSIEQSIVAPLYLLGEAHGLLVVTGKDLKEADVPAVSAFANQTAIALENARLHQEEIAWAAKLEQRVEERSAELMQSEERFRSAFDLAAIGRALATPDGRFQMVNNVLCEITGYTREELLTKTWPEITHPNYLEASIKSIEQLLKGQIPSYQMEQQALHKDGHGIWINLNIVLARDAHGNPLLLISDIEDISVRKETEEKIRILNEELEQRVLSRTEDLEAAVKELEAFSYSVSHDLRAPLRAMDGFARILNEDFSTRLPEEGQRYLGKVRESAQKMETLIDDLLAFSRLGRRAIKEQNVKPTPIVHQALKELQADLVDRDVKFTIGELCECQSDPVMLRQVFVNLLQNAIKFTRDREPALIEVGCRSENNRKGVSLYFVKDNGVGFDMRYVDKLFGVFQRLHRSEDYEGTGVGLATVQRIIQRHGGRIWAEAEVDKGATFYFTLPNGEEFGTGRKTEGLAVEFPG